MDKFICFILVATTMFSLVGCGSSEDSGGLRFSGGGITERSDDHTKMSENTDTETTETTAITEEIVTEPATSAVETDAPVPEVKKEFAPGKVSSTKYESEFIGIGCNLGISWEFYSEKQIQELNNFYASNTEEKYSEFLSNIDTFCDMSATNKTGTDSVEIELEKMDPSLLFMLDMNTYYELTAPGLVKLCEDLGYTNISYKIEFVDIEEKILPCIKINAKVNGHKVYFLFFAIKCNGYIATVSVITHLKDTTGEIIKKFYLI